MFENCFPNILDTTVDFAISHERPDTYVITGDSMPCGFAIAQPIRYEE